MQLVDWLMRRWADAIARRDLCRWCRARERDAGTHLGRYCSEGCQVADAEDQMYGA